MACEVCGNPIAGLGIEDGVICDQCYCSMPRCAQENREKLSVENIRKLQTICSKEGPNAVIRYNKNLAICNEGFWFSGCYFAFNKIKTVRLIFHPKRRIQDYVFSGSVALFVETKNKIIMEDVFEENSTALLKNAKKREFDIDLWLQKICILIGECARYNKKAYEQRFYDELKEYVKKSYEWDDQARRKKMWDDFIRGQREADAWEKAQAESQKRSSQGSGNHGDYGSNRHNSGNTGAGSSRASYGKRENTGNKSSTPTYEDALLFFGLKAGYTKDELRKNRNMLMKLYHPDGSGSDEMSTKVNICYSILEKHLS